MNQVICIKSTVPHDKGAEGKCAVKGCIYTPIYRGPVDWWDYPETNDFYEFIEIPGVFHRADCFRDIDTEIEEIEINEHETSYLY